MSKIIINQEATFVSDGNDIIDTLNELSDVTISSPSNGQILEYNGLYWQNVPNTAPSFIDDLTDVVITSVADGELLVYDAGTGKWINQAGGAGVSAIDDLSDVTVTSPADGELLVYNSTSSEWENSDTIDGGTY